MPPELSAADRAHRADMVARLQRAADHFSLTLTGDPVFGWHDRTIGSKANGFGGERWIRVSWSHQYWAEGDYWTGNLDASSISGVPKPNLVGEPYEWEEGSHRSRAEVMNLVADRRCSTTQELREELDLPDHWWSDLRGALETLTEHPTNRGSRDQNELTRQLLSFFGSGVNPIVTRWTTAHGDLNWTNITQPKAVLLDWEWWGIKPAGYDAATLHVLSLLTPDTARRIHETFADQLDSPDGVRTQLFVTARYLKRVQHGDFTDYADHLHRHARQLIDRATGAS